jgi:hypothetical protein
MGVQNPSLWCFNNCLRKVQAGRNVLYSQLKAGKNPPKKFKKIFDTNKRILRIIQCY